MKVELYHSLKNSVSLTPVKFERGSVVVKQGSRPEYGFIVRSGFIKASDEDHAGNLRTLLIFEKNDIFPVVWTFDHPPEVEYDYVAFTDVKLERFSIKELSEVLKNNSTTTRIALEYIVNLNWDLAERIKTLQLNNTREMLMSELPYIAVKLGKRIGPGIYKVNNRIPQHEFSQMLGLSRESVSTNMKTLEQDQIISHANGTYTVYLNNIPEQYINHHWLQNYEKSDS